MKIKTILLILLIATVNIFSQSFELVVTNNTNGILEEVSIAPPGAEFEYNYLDMDLGPGASTTILYESDNSGNCMFDVLAYSPAGTSFLKVDLDLCADQKIYISDADMETSETSADNTSSSGGSSAGIKGKLTANKWMMMFNGEEYGQLTLRADGTAQKTGAGGYSPISDGTWSVDESAMTLTMDYPSEGATTGNIKDLGGEFEVSYYDGAIVWKLIKM